MMLLVISHHKIHGDVLVFIRATFASLRAHRSADKKKTLTKHWWDIAAYYYEDDGGAISNYKKVVFWDQVHEDASTKELDEATKHT